MKIRLTTDRNGMGWEQREGDVIDVPPAEAASLIRCGQAETVPEERPIKLKQTPTRR